MRLSIIMTSLVMTLAIAGQVTAADDTATTPDAPVAHSATPVAPDNAGRNAKDGPAALSALDQGNSADDIRITQEIRKAVVADGDLSTNAHNVKIITRDCEVTLRGPVANADECKRIVDIATREAGVKKVHNEIEPTGDKKP